MSKIGIVTVAVQIEQNIIERFKTTLAESTRIPYCLKIVSGNNYLKNGLLNKSRALNDGLREMIKQCEVIVCTDIDMLIPPALVNYTLHYVQAGFNLWVICRNISKEAISPLQWNRWLPSHLRTTGFGSWNAMLKEDWIRSGGWDERLIGWGGEDAVFLKRREQAGIKTISCRMFPLMHVRHGPRQNKVKFLRGNEKAVALGMSGSPRNWLLCK